MTGSIWMTLMRVDRVRPRARGPIRMVSTVCFVLFLVSGRGAAGQRIAFVQTPAKPTAPAGPDIGNTFLAGGYSQGMRIVLAELPDISGTLRVVSNGFVCATDPRFSFDGRRLVFAGKREPDAPLQIWELADLDAPPRRITHGEADCIQPVYRADGTIVFTSLLAGEYEEHGGLYSFSLYATEHGEGTATRLTFNPGSDFDPVVLPDGRVLYSSWQHVGNHNWPRGSIALMFINADGTGIFPFTGNHRGPWLKRRALPLATGRIGFIQADRFESRGAGAPVTVSLNDAFAPYEAMSVLDRYQVSGLARLPDGTLLASARPADGASETFGLYVAGADEVRCAYNDPVCHDLAPVVGAPTARPERRASTVVPETPYGYLLVANCFDTDRVEPDRLRRGGVSAIRVIEGRPLRRDERGPPEFISVPGRENEPLVHRSSATGHIPTRILGEVPPAADGSVYLKVPADRPLRLQLLDDDGFSVINEQAWFWVRPNERRVCIGCHENRELSANNAAPLAAKEAPRDLTDSSGWRTVSFCNDILPILTANCAVADCHRPPKPTAGMNLSADLLNGDKDPVLAKWFVPAYANLLKRQEGKPFAVGGRRIHPGDARSSPLLWMLYGRELTAQYSPAPFDQPIVEPHPSPEDRLSDNELELIRTWVDLGAPYDEEVPTGPRSYWVVSAEKSKVTRDQQ